MYMYKYLVSHLIAGRSDQYLLHVNLCAPPCACTQPWVLLHPDLFAGKQSTRHIYAPHAIHHPTFDCMDHFSRSAAMWSGAVGLYYFVYH